MTQSKNPDALSPTEVIANSDAENLIPDSQEVVNSTEKSSSPSPLLCKFNVLMQAADMEKEIDTLADQYCKTASLPGFRKGKVTADVFKKNYHHALVEEVLQSTIPKLAYQHIETEKWEIAAQPVLVKMDYSEGQDLSAEMEVELLPQFEVAEPQTIEIEVAKKDISVEIYDEDKQIDLFLESHKQTVPVKDREICDHDLVAFQLQSKTLDTKRMTPKKASYFMMQTEKEGDADIPDLYQELLNKRPGDQITIQRTYPADYKKKIWAGKTIEHSLHIETIYELKKPLLDDTLLKSAGFQTVEDFKTRLKDEYAHQQEHKRQEKITEHVFEKLSTTLDFPIPQSLVTQEATQMITKNNYPVQFKTPEEKEIFLHAIEKAAANKVKVSLILNQYRKQFKIEVAQEDIEKEYKHIAEHHNVTEKEVRKFYLDKKNYEQLKDNLIDQKVISFIRDQVKIKEV